MSDNRTTIRNIEPKMLHEARRVCRWSGWTMGALMSAALADYLRDIPIDRA
jgi:hypothetical protein